MCRSGERCLNLELDPEFAAIADMVIELAGLCDPVRVIVGRSDTSLDRFTKSGEIKMTKLMFIHPHNIGPMSNYASSRNDIVGLGAGRR